MSDPAIFLDRDGVIIVEANYLSDPEQVELLPGTAEAIAALNRAGAPAVVVTNQSGVARGYFPESRIRVIHERLDELLAEKGAHIEKYYHCPHHPTKGTGPYLKKCDCRKPEPGLLHRAAAELDLDLGRSFMVGDKLSDTTAGRNAGCRSILVRTGYGHTYTPEQINDPRYGIDHVAADLMEAVRYCLPLL
jgi:D-glycero-D-manno-heptose 1,7-bisphosphate phosphatase